MKRLYMILLVLALSLVACASTEDTPAPIVTALSTETATVTSVASQTATVMPSATLPPPSATVEATLTTAPSEEITPEVVMRCPQQRYVSLSDLGLDETSYLLVKTIESVDDIHYENPDAEWLLIAHDETTIPVAKPEGAVYRASSPDRQWFMFYTGTPDTPINIGISSLDGTQQWFALEQSDLSFYSWGRWVNDDSIVFNDSLGGRYVYTSQLLNPFTGELTAIEEINFTPQTSEFGPTGLQFIYNHLGWRLHDFEVHTDEAILPWLNSYDYTRTYVNWTADHISIGAFEVGEGRFNVALRLSLADLAKPEVPLYNVVLPTPEEIDLAPFWWWSSDSQYALFELVYGSNENQYSYQTYLLDTTEWVLYDYCVDEDDGFRGLVVASPDERFLAGRGKRDGEFGTLIFEIVSGRRAWLPGVTALVWGTPDAEVGR